MPRLLKAVLVGAQSTPMAPHTHALGCLKAYADREPALSGRVSIRPLEFLLPCDADSLLRAIVAEEPDVVGFSCYIWNAVLFAGLWPRVRAALPDALLVAGGPQAYPRAEALMSEAPALDLVALGEGEVVFAEILKARLDGVPWSRVPGVAYRGDGGVRLTEPPPQVQDLDLFPSPYLTDSLAFGTGERAIVLETSRGCPYDCKFCDWPDRRQAARAFSVERVLAELAHALARIPTLEAVFLADSDLFLDKKRAVRLLRGMRELGAPRSMRIAFELYPARLDAETAAFLDSPAFLFSAGVQTTTPAALKAVNRFFHREKVEAAFRLLHEKAPSASSEIELIFGLPGDDLEGFRATLDWSLARKPAFVVPYPALVLPGADMGQHPERYGVEYDRKPPHRVLSTTTCPREELEKCDDLGVRLDFQNRFPFLRNTLAVLGKFAEGAQARPYLSRYEEFAARLGELALLPRERLSQGDGQVGGGAQPWLQRLISDPAKVDLLFSALEDYARESLARLGRAEHWPAVRSYLGSQRRIVEWRRLVERGDRETVLAPLERALDGRRRALWVGLEVFFPEAALCRGDGWDASFVHCRFLDDYRWMSCGPGADHVWDAEALLARLDSRADRDAFVLSHVYLRLDPRARRAALESLLAAAPRGARLAVWDDLAGPSPLERLGRIDLESVPREAPAPARAEDVAAELEASGWELLAPPRELGPRVVFDLRKP